MGVDDVFALPVRSGSGLAGRSDIPSSVKLLSSYPDTELDLVIVATDTSRHVDDALEALGHNPRSLLLEKPVSPDAASARTLAAHPRADTITVSAPLRFHQGLAVMAELLPRMGRVTSAQVRSQSWLPSWRPLRDYRDSYSARAAEGGALRDLVHDIDYPVMLLGAPSSLRASLGQGILDIEAEEAADLLWGDDAAVHIRLDYVSRVKTRSIRVSTTEGALSWDVVSNTVALETMATPGARRSSASFPDDASVDVVLARQTLAVLERAGICFSNLMERYEPATLHDGIRAVAICDAARAAHSSGGEVTIVW
jgi:predicted dehydrogenase